MESNKNIQLNIQAMRYLYIDDEEDSPPNSPEPKGHPVQMNVFVDSDHDRGRITRRSHTGILLYINSALIYWYSEQTKSMKYQPLDWNVLLSIPHSN